MKPRHIIPALVACLTLHAAEPNSAIITDPYMIVESTTYDLGERLLTVQEVTKEALPMPPPPPTPVEAAPSPALKQLREAEVGFLSVSANVYRRSGQPARTLVNYHPQGSAQGVRFWSSADWSLIAPLGSLTDANGKIWQLMCMYSTYDDEIRAYAYHTNGIDIPEFPAGKSTNQIISGDAALLAPLQPFLNYYDANLPELQAAHQRRVEEQQRLAAEEKANPKVPEDITVQYRILAPEEIVTPVTSEK